MTTLLNSGRARDLLPSLARKFGKPVSMRRADSALRVRSRKKQRLAKQDVRTAERVQSQLFPKRPPKIPGLDLAGGSYSAGIGCCDFYDFLTLPNGQPLLVVGDVSGRGMPSAVRMVEIRACLRSLVRYHDDLGVILSELNQFTIREAVCGGDGTGRFVTLFLAAVDMEKEELVYASAGHAGYVLRKSGRTLKLGGTGLPLGIADLPMEKSQPISLAAGDMLLIATDGIEEAMARSGEQLGTLRMLLSVARSCQDSSAQATIERLYSTVCEFAKGTQQRDDIVAIVAKIKHFGMLQHDPLSETSLVLDLNS